MFIAFGVCNPQIQYTGGGIDFYSSNNGTIRVLSVWMQAIIIFKEECIIVQPGFAQTISMS